MFFYAKLVTKKRMTSAEIRKKFLDFMERNSHTIVPSSSLIPDDPSVLLTTAGMQQFKPYYSELDPETTPHPLLGKPIGKNAASIQKSFRTSDIDEVGDETHLTFFEMLGNFSFGGYAKEKAIELAYKFITGEMGLTISYVTVFEGKDEIGVPKDTESYAIWKKLDPELEVKEQGMDDVFWGPTGTSGPCGPTTEIYCQNEEMKKAGVEPVEIWNIVFNEYFFPGSRDELNSGASLKKLQELPKFGVDTGMGLERLAMVAQGKTNIFETDLLEPLATHLPKTLPERVKRIIADHLRASIFLLADNVRPSNKEQGYILRRILRRVLAYQFIYHPHVLPKTILDCADKIKSIYAGFYTELNDIGVIKDEISNEGERFGKAIEKGLKELSRIEKVDAASAFSLYESFGLPFEVIKDHSENKVLDLTREDFDKEFAKHQEISRAGQEKKFGGHGLLLDTGELRAADEEELRIVTRLHTATHMLQQALREVLGPEVTQAGSDITVKRTRFDFTFPRKLTVEEVRQVEGLVNEKIKEDLPMQKISLPRSEAEKTGALYFFKGKYPDPVNVYFIGHDIKTAWSKEFCGGPHVGHTGEIGQFKIEKEEAVAAGVRRIRGILRE